MSIIGRCTQQTRPASRSRTCQQTKYVRKISDMPTNKICQKDTGHANKHELSGKHLACQQTRHVMKISDMPTNNIAIVRKIPELKADNTCQEDVGHANKQYMSGKCMNCK